MIESELREDRSPEEVSEWLKLGEDIRVSDEPIVVYILTDKRTSGDLH